MALSGVGVSPDDQAKIAAGIIVVVNIVGSLINKRAWTQATGAGGGRRPPGTSTHLLMLAVLAGLLMPLIGGCGALGLATPATPAQQLAEVDAQFAAAVSSAADLRDAGVLTPADARRVDPYIQQGNRALAAAWVALGDHRPQDALDYLPIINRALLQLRQALAAAKSPPSASAGVLSLEWAEGVA